MSFQSTDDFDGVPGPEFEKEIAAIRADLERLGTTIAELARQQADRANAGISVAIDSAVDQARRARARVDSHLNDAEADIRRRIVESPIAAALIFTAFGYLVGRVKS
jgi:hypothetical protein